MGHGHGVNSTQQSHTLPGQLQWHPVFRQDVSQVSCPNVTRWPTNNFNDTNNKIIRKKCISIRMNQQNDSLKKLGKRYLLRTNEGCTTIQRIVDVELCERMTLHSTRHQHFHFNWISVTKPVAYHTTGEGFSKFFSTTCIYQPSTTQAERGLFQSSLTWRHSLKKWIILII